MSDSRFFKVSGPFTLRHLAEIAECELQQTLDPEALIHNIAPLSRAGAQELSFLDNPHYLNEFRACRAEACIVKESLASQAPKNMALLISKEPYRAYARIAQLFHPLQKANGAISAMALIDPTAIIGEGCQIEPGAVIGPQAKLGRRVYIGANTVVGAAVEIDDDSVIGTLVSLSHCLIGKNVRILAGACVGQEGFGFAVTPTGYIRIPQLGRVIIEDDVEIGANSTVDRGSGPDTIIGRGSMIDNLVQIAHNVVLGQGCIIVAQAGVAGSSQLGEFVSVGGQTGIVGHLKVGARAKIAGHSGVMRDVEPGAHMMGMPAIPSRQFFRQIAWIGKKVTGQASRDLAKKE